MVISFASVYPVVLASIYYHFVLLTAIMLIALALLDDVPIMTIAFDNAHRAAAAGEMAIGISCYL